MSADTHPAADFYRRALIALDKARVELIATGGSPEVNQTLYPSVQAAPPADTSPPQAIPGRSADGLAAPALAPGAARHPRGWPVDWDAVRDNLAAARALPDALAGGMRDELAEVRALAVALVHTAQDLVARIDRIDPTPGALATAATDIDAYRR